MGYVIYFIHAFPLSSKMWINQLKYFGSKAKVVAVDLPGFGGMTDETIPEKPSIDDYAKFVEDLIETTREKSDKLVLVGLSMGGYVIQSILKRGKISPDFLVLANTRSEADSDEVRQRRLDLIERAKKENSIKPIFDFYIPALVGDNEKLRSEVLKIAEDTSLSGAVKALWAMAFRPDMTDTIRKFDKNKLLLIAGKYDKLSPPEVMRRISPESRLSVLECGHLSAMEKPDEFNKIVDEFLFG